MAKIKTFFKLLRTNRKGIKKAMFDNFAKTPFSHLICDKCYIKMQFKAYTGRKLDIKHPKTFNEKLQWLKLYNRDKKYTEMVDKLLVKDYIARTIGSEYVIKTLGVYDKVEDLDINTLPKQFVIKCTHDSGSVIICKDKESFDFNKAKKKLKKALKRNMFWHGREWQYKNVKPRILVEEYLVEETGELKDYKFMCFNGQVKCSFVCSSRFSKEGLHVTFFDREWKVLPFEREFPHVKEGFEKPKNYQTMILLAEKLSSGIPFVRVDFYECDNEIYFGELTFTPGNGVERFSPEEWDLKLGEWIDLGKINK